MAGEESNGHSTISPDWDETVSTKQQLLDNWDKLCGEDILEKLDFIWTAQNTGVPQVDLRQNLDLWLLKALAQEKCLYIDLKEIEKTYRHCLHLGRWNSVFVRNNLAVVKARRQECLDSLNLLADAIQLSVQHKVLLRAPFYNAALIFQHLHHNRLIFEPKYLGILDKISDSIRSAEIRPEAEASPDSDGDNTGTESAEQPTLAERGDPEVEEAYKRIARYGNNMEELPAKDIFQENVAYLVPSLDLFESFGDSADKVDTRTAHEFFEQGNDFAAQERFDAGIKSFELGVELDPERANEARERTDHITEQWRYRENQRMLGTLREGEFDKATSIILDLPDPRLRRPNDDQVVSAIRRFKQSALLRKAEETAKLEGEAEARSTYISLLKEVDLDDSLRMHVSGKLAEPLRQINDDRERHQKLKELILYGLHPQISNRLGDEFEKHLVMQALALTQLGQFEEAIEKYFWALLLPGRGQRRETLMQSALYVLELFLKTNTDIDACQSIADPIFSDLKAELTERWNDNRKVSLAAKFERLDSEQWLTRKRIDELLELLDELIQYEPTTERRIAKLRLCREKEAQQHYENILAELGKISKEGDHSKRRDAIFVELRALRELAVDFAAGDHSAYAQQITDFVVDTEEYLRRANNQKTKHEITIEANRRREEEFQRFRDTLRDGTDMPQVLTFIADILRKMYGTHLFDEATDLSIHWLHQNGKAAYRALVVERPEQAGAILRDSLAIIERHRSVLPEEFKTEFRALLEDLAREFEPPEPEPQPEPPPPPPPPPPPDGLWRRFNRWLGAKLGRRETR